MQISRWYTIATVPVLIVINLISALSQSREKFAVYNGIRLMIPLFNVGGLFVLWGLGMLSIQLVAAIYFVTSFSVVAWAIYANRNELRLRWFKDRVDQSSAKKLFGYGSKVYGVELLGTLYTQFDKIIILALLTPRDFGLYSVVFALS
ncbi:oligosaccharide flippase family protein [Paenibacillus amylolyticus]|nr:oligosaccharide flippase family protein [Paenibacillus amylolyticus]